MPLGTFRDLGALPVGGIDLGAVDSIPPVTQRGNIDYDQIKAVARHGDGSKIQMFTGSSASRDVAVFDALGNVASGGGSGTWVNAANDAAAAAGGVAVGGLYRNGSVVMVRVS